MSPQLTIGWRSLRYVTGLPADRARELAPILAAGMILADATSRDRAAALIAQWAHESDRFRTRREYASGAAYEGRTDLGNHRKGDGVRYAGGGWIQLTGRTNYARATRWVDDRWGTITRLFPWIRRKAPPDFTREPSLVRDFDTWATVTSALWWRQNGCNAYADRHDFIGLTRRINGGTNGLADRQALHKRARRVSRYLVPKER